MLNELINKLKKVRDTLDRDKSMPGFQLARGGLTNRVKTGVSNFLNTPVNPNSLPARFASWGMRNFPNAQSVANTLGVNSILDTMTSIPSSILYGRQINKANQAIKDDFSRSQQLIQMAKSNPAQKQQLLNQSRQLMNNVDKYGSHVQNIVDRLKKELHITPEEMKMSNREFALRRGASTALQAAPYLLTPEMIAAKGLLGSVGVGALGGSFYGASQAIRETDKKKALEDVVGGTIGGGAFGAVTHGAIKGIGKLANSYIDRAANKVVDKLIKEGNLDEAFLKYKGNNFDDYISKHKDRVLEWVRNKGLPEDIVHNKQVGEYLKNEFENAAKRKIINKKMQLLTGLTEEEIDKLLDTGASPTEIMAELRRQKKVRKNSGPVSIGKILGKYDPEQILNRLKGKSIEEMIDSEVPKNSKWKNPFKANKYSAEDVINNMTAEEKARFGGNVNNSETNQRKIDFNKFIEKIPEISDKIKTEKHFKTVEGYVSQFAKQLDDAVRSRGYTFEDFVNQIESGNIDPKLQDVADITKKFFNNMKAFAEKRNNRTFGNIENYWHRASSDTIKGWKPKTAGDVLTPSFGYRREGKLTDYVKSPETLIHYWREAVGTHNPEELKKIRVANKAREYYEKYTGLAKKMMENKKNQGFSLTNELEKYFKNVKPKDYGKPKSTFGGWWIDKLAGRDNVSDEFYKDFLYKFKKAQSDTIKEINKIKSMDIPEAEKVKKIILANRNNYIKAVNEFINNAIYVRDPELKKIVDRIFDEYVGNEIKLHTIGDKIINYITNKTAKGALGLNFKSALNNVYEVKRIYALVKQDAFNRGLARVARGEDLVQKYGIDVRATIANEAEKLSDQLSKLMGKGNKDWIMSLFNKSEWLKDNVMLAALEEHGISKGLKGEELARFVRDKFDQYAIKFGVGQNIPIYKNKWMRLLGQFTQYSVKDSMLLLEKISQAFEGDKGAQKYLAKMGFGTLLQSLSNWLILGTAMAGGEVGISLVDTISNLFDKNRKWYERIPMSPIAKLGFIAADRAIGNNDEFQKTMLDRSIKRTMALAVPAGNQLINKTGAYLRDWGRGYYETVGGNVASPVGKGVVNFLRGVTFGRSYDSNRRKYIDELLKGNRPSLNKYQSEVFKRLPKDKREAYYNAVSGSNGSGSFGKSNSSSKSLAKLMSTKNLSYRDTKTIQSFINEQLNAGLAPDPKLIDKLYERAKSDTNTMDDLYKQMSYILKDPGYTDEQKDVIRKKLPDIDYYMIASRDPKDRRRFAIESISNIKDRNELIKKLASYKKSVGDKSILTNSDIKYLYDRGYITSDEKKYLYAVKWDEVKQEFYLDKNYIGGSGSKKVKIKNIPTTSKLKISSLVKSPRVPQMKPVKLVSTKKTTKVKIKPTKISKIDTSVLSNAGKLTKGYKVKPITRKKIKVAKLRVK